MCALLQPAPLPYDLLGRRALVLWDVHEPAGGRDDDAEDPNVAVGDSHKNKRGFSLTLMTSHRALRALLGALG